MKPRERVGFREDRSEAFRKSASRWPEPWYFGIEPSQLGAFLGARGFALLDDTGAAEYQVRYLRRSSRDLAVSEIERVVRASVRADGMSRPEAAAG